MPPPLPDASVEAGRGCKTKHTDRVCGSRTLHVTAPSQHFLPPEGASGAGVGAVAAGVEDEVSGPGSVDADVGAEQEQAEGMTAPVAVHQLSADGGRRVFVRTSGRTQILGIAYSDRDLVEFLRRAGTDEAHSSLDDPDTVRWHGGRPHEWLTA